MKVYILEVSDYDAHGILGVCSTKRKALEAALACKGNNEVCVSVYDVDAPLSEPKETIASIQLDRFMGCRVIKPIDPSTWAHKTVDRYKDACLLPWLFEQFPNSRVNTEWLKWLHFESFAINVPLWHSLAMYWHFATNCVVRGVKLEDEGDNYLEYCNTHYDKLKNSIPPYWTHDNETILNTCKD